jgi:hypothetical protein
MNLSRPPRPWRHACADRPPGTWCAVPTRDVTPRALPLRIVVRGASHIDVDRSSTPKPGNAVDLPATQNVLQETGRSEFGHAVDIVDVENIGTAPAAGCPVEMWVERVGECTTCVASWDAGVCPGIVRIRKVPLSPPERGYPRLIALMFQSMRAASGCFLKLYLSLNGLKNFCATP